MGFREWWKNLAYWKKGGIIGFIVGFIIAITISFQIGECWTCIFLALPAFIILGNIHTYPGPPILSTILIIMFIILPYVMLGSLFGILIKILKGGKKYK